MAPQDKETLKPFLSFVLNPNKSTLFELPKFDYFFMLNDIENPFLVFLLPILILSE